MTHRQISRRLGRHGNAIALLTGLLALGPGRAGAEESVVSLLSPVETVQSLHQQLIRAAANADGSVQSRFEALLPVVEATHDTRYIAELTVRRFWDDFSLEQQFEFLGRFLDLSAMTYASRFRNVSADTFEIVSSEELQNGRSQVLTMIRRTDADDVTLDYLLHETADGWKIINIVASGVSDLALKRAEYRRILTDGSVDDLLDNLREQIADLN